MDTNLTLYISPRTIAIKKDNQIVSALDRTSLEQHESLPEDQYDKIPFYSILGLFRYETLYYLVLIQKTKQIVQFNQIHQIKSFRIIPLQSQEETIDSKYFSKLLKIGLNQCQMYFSEISDLTLTLPQQLNNQRTRELFIWNLEGIKCLNDIWPNMPFFTPVIAGHINSVGPFILISKRCNKNGGCHTWNRGVDEKGYAANFVETEEIFFTKDCSIIDAKSEFQKINAISHVEIAGSCPIFWSQYPTMQLGKPFHYGPEGECKRRFNLHFDKLEELYSNFNSIEGHYYSTSDIQKNNNQISILNLRKENSDPLLIDSEYSNGSVDNDSLKIMIISLLQTKGKENKMTNIYEQYAQERGIEFTKFDFNKYCKEEGGLRNKIENFKDIADATVIKEGEIINNQTRLFRINCASCLDRTSVFMSILYEYVLKKYSDSTEFDYRLHTSLWYERANMISLEYAGTPGLKTHMMGTGTQPKIASFFDSVLSIERYISSFCREGKLTDSFNAVLQERKFSKFEPIGHIWRLLIFLYLIFLYTFLIIFRDKKDAYFAWKSKIKRVIDHPHIEDLRDADEFMEDDFRGGSDSSTNDHYP